MKSKVKVFLVLFYLTISTNVCFGQTLIMNEVSNGPAGNQEYVEFVVVDTVVTYNCSATTPPCIDIRGWIFDDNSGYHGAFGVAAGAVRFSFDPIWACVPLGTIILIYNDADPNVELPTADITMSDGNCNITAPISNTVLFEKNTTTPGAIACSYPATGWTAGGLWTYTLLANSGDCARIVNLAGCEVFSVCWATANLNTLIYFNSGGSGTQNVWYFNDGDPNLQANWTEGSASVGANQTPGAPNNAANAAFIGQFNNSCTPITPILVTATSSDAGCTCTGSATASSSGSIPGYTYMWFDNTYTPIGQTTETATGLCAGTYHVISTSSIGCSDTATVLVNAIGATSVVVDDATICSGESATLTATPDVSGGTYLWSPGGETTQSIIISPTVTTDYSVIYTYGMCTAMDTGTVTVIENPLLTITDPAAVCSPLTVDLTAAVVTAGSTNVGTLTYWEDASATTTLTSPSSVSESGIYYIHANNSGCIDIEPVTVTINPSPILTITNPAAVCSPSTVDLTAAAVTAGSTNVGTLSYWEDAGATIVLVSPSTVSMSGTYYIQATNGSCTDIEAVVVDIITTPDVVTNDPSAVCSPLTIDLTDPAVTAGSSNLSTLTYWEDAGATIVLASPSAVSISGIYYIQSGITGCSDIEPVTVTINPSPILTITNPAAVCSPSTVDLTAAAVTAGSTNVGTLSYWEDASATIVLASPSTVSMSGTYYIQATNGSCTDIEAVVVDIITTPDVVTNDPAAVCSPLTIDLTDPSVTAGSTNLSTLTYWEDAGATIVLASPSAVSISGIYYIQSGMTGCSDIEPVTVTINPSPILTITNPAAVCSPSTVDLTAAAVTAGSTNVGTLSYWEDASATIVLASPSTVSMSGTYYIQATNGSCTDIEAVIVTINPMPSAPSAGTNTTYCSNWDFATMTVIGTGGIYTWYSNFELTLEIGSGGVLSPNESIGTSVYYVTETVSGCESPADSVIITIEECEIIVPTAFTPDGDNVNDYWEIVDLDAVYPNNIVLVYNRWGSLLFQSEEGKYADSPWKGDYNGEKLPVGSYYFIIDFNSEKTEPLKGVVSIILE